MLFGYVFSASTFSYISIQKWCDNKVLIEFMLVQLVLGFILVNVNRQSSKIIWSVFKVRKLIKKSLFYFIVKLKEDTYIECLKLGSKSLLYSDYLYSYKFMNNYFVISILYWIVMGCMWWVYMLKYIRWMFLLHCIKLHIVKLNWIGV